MVSWNRRNIKQDADAYQHYREQGSHCPRRAERSLSRLDFSRRVSLGRLSRPRAAILGAEQVVEYPAHRYQEANQPDYY